MRKFIYSGIIGLFLLSSCSSKSSNRSNPDHQEIESHHDGDNHGNKEHEEEQEDGTGTHQNAIILPQAKAEAAGVKTRIIHPGAFEQVIKTSGQILTAQGDERTVVAPISGIVSFRGRLVEGTSISKDAPIAILSSNNLAEGDPVQRARIAYDIAQKEYERMKTLVTSQIVSEKEFAQARQAYETARLSYEAVAKNHSASGQTVPSPIGGFIKNLLVKEGEYVEVGQPIANVTQNRKLFLRADISEKYYSHLRTINSANFRTPYDNKVYTLKDLNGKLLSYGKSTGNETGYYIPMTFEFDNKSDVVPGAFVEVFLLSSPLTNVISVPHSALTEEQGSFFIYLQLDKEHYKKQLVTLGADNGNSIQILSGIRGGDCIVVEGAYQMKMASASTAIPTHTHEH